MNKGNICILMLLVSLFFVSCVIGVSEASQAGSDGKEKGDIEKLKIFIDNANDYRDTFRLIYGYGRVVDEIRTYSPKSRDDQEGKWKNPAYLDKIKEGLAKFNEDNLTNKFSELEEIIKKSTGGVYNPQGLTTSVASFKKAVEKALETLSVENTFVAREPADSYLNALHSAIITYVDSLVAVSSTLSSSEFTEAAKKFASVAKECAELDKTEIRIIILAIKGIASDKDCNNAKGHAASHLAYKEKGQVLADAIGALNVAYKKLK